jgi:hypothetical protein
VIGEVGLNPRVKACDADHQQKTKDCVSDKVIASSAQASHFIPNRKVPIEIIPVAMTTEK